MWEESWSQGRTAEPVKAKVRAMRALHMHPQYTHQQAYSAFSATDFHCKWLFSECFQAKYIPHRKRLLQHVFFADLLKIMKAVIYMLIVPSLFSPEKQVFAHKFGSIYSILCLWCMKRRFYSYRDRPLAGSLMGYGPQLHLFQWISLLGSARQRHVRACK